MLESLQQILAEHEGAPFAWRNPGGGPFDWYPQGLVYDDPSTNNSVKGTMLSHLGAAIHHRARVNGAPIGGTYAAAAMACEGWQALGPNAYQIEVVGQEMIVRYILEWPGAGPRWWAEPYETKAAPAAAIASPFLRDLYALEQRYGVELLRYMQPVLMRVLPPMSAPRLDGMVFKINLDLNLATQPPTIEATIYPGMIVSLPIDEEDVP